MAKKIFSIIVVLLGTLFVAQNVYAGEGPWPDAPTFSSTNGGSVMNDLTSNITKMAKEINTSSSQMMKFADMLRCNSLWGEAAHIKYTIMGWTLDIKLIALDIFISSLILYVIGFFIMMIASFYMFDIAFNLSIAIVLLPLALALWPFAWTREHLKKVVDSILYYTGVFIFLPLGILIAKTLVITVVNEAFSASSGGEFDFATAFKEDNSDLIRDNLGIFTLPFLKVLVCYIIAIRLIPLMASEFCEHFFGSAMVGSPISERLAQVTSFLKKKTVDKVGAAAKRHIGKSIEKAGDKNGNFLQRSIAQYGTNMAKSQK